MESEGLTTNCRQPSMLERVLSACLPMLLIAIGYIDPGKWAAMLDGGARFGFDLIMLVFAFNFAAILCQYLSACIALVTGQDLAKICSEEYGKVTCIFLGIQAEVSMIALDLTMVLGTAHGLNVVFGVDLFSCVFLTATGAILFPLLSSLLDNGSAKFLCIGWASSLLLSYVFGVVISQPESPFSIGGMLNKFSGESSFALMSLLGASIMPHNFYLHSSIVQGKESSELSREARCQDHFFAIVFIFSGIFLVNYAVMNAAANASYSTGLLLLTFQDALSLLDQVFRSSVAPFTIMLVTFISNQITAISWDLGRQAVVHDLFGMDIPGWLHHVTIRVISIVPALYCVWNSGAEGLYQLLIFSQVVVALVLPSSVIPLFRVATSRSIMGIHKISQSMEFLSLGTFIGLLGLTIIFVFEMIFGNSDWVNSLKWNIGNGVSTQYMFLLTAASLSLFLMLWLAVTPLKSASSSFDAHSFLRTPTHIAYPESYPERSQLVTTGATFSLGNSAHKQEAAFQVEKSLVSHPDLPTSDPEQILPETLMDFEKTHHLSTIDESSSETSFSTPPFSHPEVSSASVGETTSVKSVSNEVFGGESVASSVLTTDSVEVVEKTLRIEGDMGNDKDGEGESWEREEATKEVSESTQSTVSDGPGSLKSLSGKTEDMGSGTGSLSRLAGLGRAARRQLTVVLDEFWGQLFDYHGATTQEAKSRKLDIILGLESKPEPKPAPASSKSESMRSEFSVYVPSGGARPPDSLINSNLYSPKQQYTSGAMDSPYIVPKEPSSTWSASHMKLLDAYLQSSSSNIVDSGERRYSSMRIPTSVAGSDQQPATVHGYQITAYLNQIAKERRAEYLNGQLESPSPRSVSSLTSNYAEPFTRTLGQKPQGGASSRAPPGFGNVPVARNNSMQPVNTSDRSSTETPDVNSKKFYSLPDISGRYVPRQDSLLPDGRAQWYNSVGYGQSVGRSTYEQAYMTGPLRAGGPPRLENPPKVCRDAFSLQFSSSSGTGSLWSRQPFEQFGVAGKTEVVSSDHGTVQSSSAQESTSTVDLEAKLLQSFRSCIVKLLKLDGSEWLFRQDDGADEDLIDRIAAREKFLYEAETREICRLANISETQFSSNRKPGSVPKPEEIDYTKFLVMSVPHCGEGCVWKVDIIVSFGVWCIHRILELSLMESRPELWGKYTKVLNRLQGIIDLAFTKPRSPVSHCFCLQIPMGLQQKSSPPPISNGSLPPQSKQGRGKCTTAPVLLDMIKDVEMAISCRKGRTGTAAGDVAFPNGKLNLGSVLKRYKRRLSNKPVGNQEGGPTPRKVTLPSSSPFVC